MKIAFIGLGTMGHPMANCLSAEFNVAGWDIGREVRARASCAVGSVDAALSGASAVITMLPDGPEVAHVLRYQVFPVVEPGTLLIDCSSIDVETTRVLASEAARRGLAYLDAPVSGGVEGARSGQLSFMVGGDEAAFERARPIFAPMGSRLTHFGVSGAGQAAKACHNMICGITALGVCEAFALAEALGLDCERFYALCQGAAAQSWILENRCPVPGPAPDSPASNGYAPGFAARLMAKDLRLGNRAAEAVGVQTPFCAEAARRFTAFSETGDGDLDFSAIYRTVRWTVESERH